MKDTIKSMRKIAQGAEAVLYHSRDRVIKTRIPKSYRLEEIDTELRKSRTAREAKVISIMPVAAPKLYSVDKKEMKLEMEYIAGDRLSEVLEKADYKAICRELGRMVASMHKKDIIHGDLTTSNIILKAEKLPIKDRLVFIDFGLSFFSTKAEDKAVDIHLLRQALESRHYTIWEECFREFVAGYGDKLVIRRLELVEKRGRNKAKI